MNVTRLTIRSSLQRTICLGLICFGSTQLSQTANADTPTSAKSKNEIPLYGTEPKTEAEKAADAKFIADVTKVAGTKDKAFDAITKRAWKSISQGEALDAIKRFNQAYLLKGDDIVVFWGLAVASAQRRDFAASDDMFQRALKVGNDNYRLHSDYGFMLVSQALYARSAPDGQARYGELMNKAYREYQAAQKADPTAALPYSRLATMEFYGGEYKTAWELVEESEQRGGEGLDPKFVADLERKMPRPGGEKKGGVKKAGEKSDSDKKKTAPAK